MPKKKEYLELLMSRDFYNFYKTHRKRNSKVIDEYNYFVKAVSGLAATLKALMAETEYGVHLRGLGVMYKKPFGEFYRNMTAFTRKKIKKTNVNFYLEDDYLRHRYLITNIPQNYRRKPLGAKSDGKPEAILLHRKLKLKK